VRFLKVFKHFLFESYWKKDKEEALLLAVFFSYYCKFNDIKLREELCEYLDEKVI
jgi:hypothetical protein